MTENTKLSEINLLKRDQKPWQNRSDQSLPLWVSPRHRFMGSLNIARSLPGADPTWKNPKSELEKPQKKTFSKTKLPSGLIVVTKKNEKKKGGGSQGEKNWRPFLILQDTTKKDVHHTMLPIPIAHSVGCSCLLNVSSSKKTSET